MKLDEVKNLPTRDKVRIMEALWEEFRERFETAGVTPEQKAILDARRERARNGQSEILDWDAVKDRLGRK